MLSLLFDIGQTQHFKLVAKGENKSEHLVNLVIFLVPTSIWIITTAVQRVHFGPLVSFRRIMNSWEKNFVCLFSIIHLLFHFFFFLPNSWFDKQPLVKTRRRGFGPTHMYGQHGMRAKLLIF